jgi:hypothetical protein
VDLGNKRIAYCSNYTSFSEGEGTTGCSADASAAARIQSKEARAAGEGFFSHAAAAVAGTVTGTVPKVETAVSGTATAAFNAVRGTYCELLSVYPDNYKYHE